MTVTTIEVALSLTMTFAPVLALLAVLVVKRPGLRSRMAALLASVAALLGIVILNAVAAPLGWWTFTRGPATMLGQPADLVLVWALLWGAIPTLLDRWRLRTTLAALAALDLLFMPLLPGLSLGRSWVMGEVAGLGLVAAPAIMLGRLTAQRRHLAVRVGLQVVVAALLFAVVAPMLAARLGGGLQVQGGLVRWIGLQIGVVGSVLALAAVHEFHVRGQGTPWPWDPPRRLVVTGPYRFVSNPMQLGGCLLLLGESVLFANTWLAAMGITGVLFAATSARVHEYATIGRRFGARWAVFHASVRAWVPRWRPTSAQDATLWIADGCGSCREIGDWIERRQPVALTVRHAEQHPSSALRRATYEAADGHTASGVDAFAHAAEHLDLPWAWVGLFLRLPIVRSFARLIGDAVGFGPQALASDPQEAAACSIPQTHAPG